MRHPTARDPRPRPTATRTRLARSALLAAAASTMILSAGPAAAAGSLCIDCPEGAEVDLAGEIEGALDQIEGDDGEVRPPDVAGTANETVHIVRSAIVDPVAEIEPIEGIVEPVERVEKGAEPSSRASRRGGDHADRRSSGTGKGVEHRQARKPNAPRGHEQRPSRPAGAPRSALDKIKLMAYQDPETVVLPAGLTLVALAFLALQGRFGRKHRDAPTTSIGSQEEFVTFE